MTGTARLASSSWTLAKAHQAQLAERASSYRVPALVLKLEAPRGGAWGDPGAQARWTAHDGTVITSDIAVPLGVAAGSTQWLWTTADGQLTEIGSHDELLRSCPAYAANLARTRSEIQS